MNKEQHRREERLVFKSLFVGKKAKLMKFFEDFKCK